MVKYYKDDRSIRKWLESVREKGSKEKVTFVTLSSLTSEKISQILRERYVDLADERIPKQIREYELNDRHRVTADDPYDTKLISIILFMINHILTQKFYEGRSYDKENKDVKISSQVLRGLYNDGSYISHVIHVTLKSTILMKLTEYDAGNVIGGNIEDTIDTNSNTRVRGFDIHPQHIQNEANVIVIEDCPNKFISRKLIKIWNADTERTIRFNGFEKGKVYLRSFYNVFQLRVDYDAAYDPKLFTI